MPKVARGDTTDTVATNHVCTGTTTTNECSGNVFANNIGVVRKTNLVTTHTWPPLPPCPSHSPPLDADYQPTVFANNLNVATLGSKYNGSEDITTGSSNVFAGG